MAKLIFICERDRSAVRFSPDMIQSLSGYLAPTGIEYAEPYIVSNNGILAGVLNPVRSLQYRDESIYVGGFSIGSSKWDHPGAPAPDGSYAICRANDRQVEIITDMVASRPMFYFLDDAYLIASTSQRAITALLGTYEPQKETYSWVLSTGKLGFDYAWDRRVCRLRGNETLTLDRTSWRHRITSYQWNYEKVDCSPMECEQRLSTVIDEAIEGLQIDVSEWLILLSGGYDCRAIFQRLAGDGKKTRSVTWGKTDALDDKRSDAYIAGQLANKYKSDHTYFNLTDDGLSLGPATILDRFVTLGEGSTDHLSGYMDGFALWRKISATGCQGVIRGDEAFGRETFRREFEVYKRWDHLKFEEYDNAEMYRGLIDGLPEQNRNDILRLGTDESLACFRDRFYSLHEMFNVLGPLNEMKSWFCEIVNPLLHRQVLEVARSLPESCLTDKILFKKIVDRSDSEIPIASRMAIQGKLEILSKPEFVNYLCEYLESKMSMCVLPAIGVQEILDAVNDYMTTGRLKRGLQENIARVRKHIPGLSEKVMLTPLLVAFRAYTILHMHELLERDANLFR